MNVQSRGFDDVNGSDFGGSVVVTRAVETTVSRQPDRELTRTQRV